MKTLPLFHPIVPRRFGLGYAAVANQVSRRTDGLLRRYANWRVGAQKSEIYNDSDSLVLTFDDYGSAEQIKRLLAILKAKNVRAVFFVQGDFAAAQPDLVALIADAGHVIGNHTYSHADLLSLNDDEIRRELAWQHGGSLMRPPRGRYDARVRRIAAELGYAIMYWSIDSDDWQGVAASAMSHKILALAHPGAVILFHMHAAHTPELLPGLIDDLRARGYALSAPSEPIRGNV